MLYPLITSLVSFWSLNFNDSSAANYWAWLSTLMLSTLQGSTFGFMFACVYDDIESGGNVMTSFTSMVTYGCGVYVNLKTGSWFVKGLGYVSPFRYLCEKLMRVLLTGLKYDNGETYAKRICDEYAWTFEDWVIPISVMFFVIFFFTAWISIVIKAREF